MHRGKIMHLMLWLILCPPPCLALAEQQHCPPTSSSPLTATTQIQARKPNLWPLSRPHSSVYAN